MADTPNNETRSRILDVAERLFSQRGYAAVTLRDIAGEVGMKHASLYYYAPGGKEQLFVEVMERNFQRHYEGAQAAIAGAGGDFRAQIHAVAAWFASQPPISVGRMYAADLPAIDRQTAKRLMRLSYDALRLPIGEALRRAQAAGEVEVDDIDTAALALVSLLQSVHGVPTLRTRQSRIDLAQKMADMLLYGWFRRT